MLTYLVFLAEFDDYAEIVDDDPDYAHPMAGIYALGGWSRDVLKKFCQQAMMYWVQCN